MKRWADIEAIASDRKEGQLQELLDAWPPHAIEGKTDSDVLEAFGLHIFSSGFRWRVVQAKKDDIRAAFADWDVDAVAGFDVEDIERLAQDTRVIRHKPKIVSIVENARFVQGVASEHGSMIGRLRDWPTSDIVGLFAWLKKDGSRLGGNTGPRALRSLGVDCYILTPSVASGLMAHAGFAKAPTGKGAQKKAQECFDAWHAESGRSYTELSRILAYSVP